MNFNNADNEDQIDFYRQVNQINEDSGSDAEEYEGDFYAQGQGDNAQDQNQDGGDGGQYDDRMFHGDFDNEKLHQDDQNQEDENDLRELENQLLDFDTGVCSKEDLEGNDGEYSNGENDLEAKINEQIRQDQFLLEKEQFKRQLMMGLNSSGPCDSLQPINQIQPVEVCEDESIQ